MTRREAGSSPASPAGSFDGERRCITCADEGVVMRVLAPPDDGLAPCAADDGGRQTVDVSLVGPVIPGDTVLVHAGVALQKLGGEAPGEGAP